MTCTTIPGAKIGTLTNAMCAANGWYCSCGCDPEAKEIAGQGESRTAWLIEGVVYKTGRTSANEYEHAALTAWREAGARWAPQTTLYRLTDGYGDPVTVLAMPYLPDDGSPVEEDTLAEIKAVAPQTYRDNYTATACGTYLIDGVDVERFPA